MQKQLLFTALIFTLMLIILQISEAQISISGGANYILPANKLKEINKPAVGYSLEIQNCMLCRLWYGFRISSYSMTKADEILLSETYYNKILLLEPSIRYNFISNISQSWKRKLIPYVELTGIISSMDKTDNEEKLGLGYSIGLGSSLSFQWIKKCWSIDLRGAWVNPNPLVFAETRQSIQYVDIKLNVGVSLW